MYPNVIYDREILKNLIGKYAINTKHMIHTNEEDNSFTRVIYKERKKQVK